MKSLLLLIFMACHSLVCAASSEQARPALVDAILVYNNFPDSDFRLLLQPEGVELPPKSIGIPLWLLSIPLTKSEAGALVAAIGVYLTPDTRIKPRYRLDRETRFDRALSALESCPAALSSLIWKLEDIDREGGLVVILREVRTKRADLAVAPAQFCLVSDQQ